MDQSQNMYSLNYATLHWHIKTSDVLCQVQFSTLEKADFGSRAIRSLHYISEHCIASACLVLLTYGSFYRRCKQATPSSVFNTFRHQYRIGIGDSKRSCLQHHFLSCDHTILTILNPVLVRIGTWPWQPMAVVFLLMSTQRRLPQDGSLTCKTIHCVCIWRSFVCGSAPQTLVLGIPPRLVQL